jgi:hypothetical protein
LGPIPTEAVSPFLPHDLRLEPARALDRGVEAAERREIEIGLVDAGLLEGVAGGGEDRHDPRRDVSIEGVILTDEDRLRLAATTRGLRQAPRARDRQGRADAVPSGRVARRRHDASAVALLGIGADDEGPVAERRIPPRLDGGVEGVHVHVSDDSHRQSRGAGSGG